LFRPLAGKKQAVRPERLGHETASLIVKRACERAGLDADAYAAHSLRSGLATSAALNGADLQSIMRQTRHKSERVARGYVRVADRWKGNVTDGLL
jgi:site-specific recombinase XerD